MAHWRRWEGGHSRQIMCTHCGTQACGWGGAWGGGTADSQTVVLHTHLEDSLAGGLVPAREAAPCVQSLELRGGHDPLLSVHGGVA